MEEELIEELEESEESIESEEVTEELVEEDSEDIEEEYSEIQTQVLADAVDLMSADVAQHLEKTNNLLCCLVFVIMIMYFRTIVFSIVRRGV